VTNFRNACLLLLLLLLEGSSATSTEGYTDKCGKPEVYKEFEVALRKESGATTTEAYEYKCGKPKQTGH
jgi:hypothetical protein